MPMTLRYGDPPTLGPFHLRARLQAGPAGIVYLGSDQHGRQVSVALLTRGAAADPAARERFSAAIREATDTPNGAAVVAADPSSTAPWVATPYTPQQPGAEGFLEPVLISGSATAVAMRGPDFRPHWAGASEPAVPSVDFAAAGGGGDDSNNPTATRVIAGVIIAVIVLLLLLLLLLFWLLSQTPNQPQSQQPKPRQTVTRTDDPTSPVSPSPGSTGKGTRPASPSVTGTEPGIRARAGGDSPQPKSPTPSRDSSGLHQPGKP